MAMGWCLSPDKSIIVRFYPHTYHTYEYPIVPMYGVSYIHMTYCMTCYTYGTTRQALKSTMNIKVD